ncbi:hypothetical protein SAMN02910455_01694 [Acidaminococcus fermentans]|uniref:phage baseplate protein n=1 Tax=Acidaminococcus fermentans TaxID=905 RepID=UPI0008E49721|nr:hypothetical protein [Acidaminococcus fermentans]SFO70400.1 hypothetical protein SAMN02910455_01694 [Acidaminococcus fermentans]
MTTRSIVPNGDGEGSLGTSTAKWGAVYSSDPASGENSGQVPTTAWVQKLLADALAKQKATYDDAMTNQKVAYEQAISTAVSAAQIKAKLDAHPVGSYYWSNDSTSPATLFGGTWEALPAGYTLIAQGSGTDDYGNFTYTAGQKYGERKHNLTTDELPSHSHDYYLDTTKKGTSNDKAWLVDAGTVGDKITDHPRTTEPTGGNQPHENLPPSIASYGWRRTA